MDDKNDQLLIVLHILEGINLNLKNDPIIISATLSGFKLETDTINPNYAADFDSKLIWETDKKSIRRMRTDNMPIKLECYALVKNNREFVGHILFPIKNITVHTTLRPNNGIQPRWYKLVGLSSKWKHLKPEFLMFNLITERHLFYSDEDDKNGQASSNENGKLDVFIPQSLKTNLNEPIKNDDFIQIGNADYDCDRFVVVIILKTAKYLEMLLSPYDPQNSQFSIKYNLLGNVCNCTLIKKLNGNYNIGEKIIINYRSSLQALQNYFSNDFLIQIELFYNNSIIGNVKLVLDNLLKSQSITDFIGRYEENNFTFEVTNSCPVTTDKEVQNYLNKPQIDYKFSIKYIPMGNHKLNTSSEFLAPDNVFGSPPGCIGAGDYSPPKSNPELPPTIPSDNKLKPNSSDSKLSPGLVTSPNMSDSKSDTEVNYKRNLMDDSCRSYSSCLSQIPEVDTDYGQDIKDFLKICEVNDQTYNVECNYTNNEAVDRMSKHTVSYPNINSPIITTNGNRTRCMSYSGSDNNSIIREFSDSESTVKGSIIQHKEKYIHCNIVLKTAKFSNVVPHGVSQISLHHRNAESYPVVNVEIGQSKLKKIDFQNIRMELIFYATLAQFQEAFKKEPCTLSITGPKKFHVETSLKPVPIIEFNVEKNNILILRNKQGDAIGKIFISVSFEFNDNGSGVVPIHAGICPKSSNAETPPETNVKDCFAEVQEELERWKRVQMEQFMTQLKQKQTKKLTQMKSKWKKKKVKQCQEVAEKVNKFDMLEAEMQKVCQKLQETEVQKFELQKIFTSEYVALSEKTSVVQEELRQRIRQNESRIIELIENEQKLMKINGKLTEQNEQFKSELEKLQETFYKNDKFINLMTEYDTLNIRYTNAIKSKDKYKEKWACSVREFNKYKSMNALSNFNTASRDQYFQTLESPNPDYLNEPDDYYSPVNANDYYNDSEF